MATEPSDRTIVLSLLRGAVPEQADTLCELWLEHGHDLEVAPSSRGATMKSTSKRIKFDTKTIDFFWLMGFTLWRAIELYSPAIVCATGTGIAIDQVLDGDDERPLLELEFRQRISTTAALLDASATDDISWPGDIPKPAADRDALKDEQEKSTFDLVLLALAFTILHELRHVMFRKTGDAPEEAYEEEMACDTWARATMTSNVATYASDNSHTFAEVTQKRATGIALAAIIVHAMTSPIARWGNDEYPPIADRLTAMIAGHALPDNSNFWLYTACLLVAALRQDRRSLDVSGDSYMAMVETLLDRLR